MTSSRRAVSPHQGSAEQQRLQSAQHEVTRAEEDYQRLRAAYLETAQREHGHEVALAMLGADMERAHARLQSLSGLRQLPFTLESTVVVQRLAGRLVQENT
jgi:hypothetical protein